MNHRLVALSAVGLILWGGSFAFASSENEIPSKPTISNISSTNEEARFVNKVGFGYQNTFGSPTLAVPSSEIDEAEHPRTSTWSENQFTFGYRVTSDFEIAAVSTWSWNSTSGQGLLMVDPYLKITKDDIIKTQNFSLTADFRISAPVSTESKENKLLTSIASEQSMACDISNSRFSLGLITSVHNLGASIHTGVLWDVAANINFKPYLDIAAGKPLALENTRVGAQLNWTLL